MEHLGHHLAAGASVRSALDFDERWGPGGRVWRNERFSGRVAAPTVRMNIPGRAGWQWAWWRGEGS